MADLDVKAFVLRAFEVGESDRILSLLTRDHGLLTVSARGVRKPRSPHLLATQVFSFATFQLVGRRGHFSLRSAELIEPFLGLHQDIDRLVCAAHLAEVFLDCLRDDGPQNGAYALWAHALQAIAVRPDPLASTLAAQMRLLGLIGLAPQLARCLRCGADTRESVWFTVAGGGLVCAQPACQAAFSDIRTVPVALPGALRHLLETPLTRVFGFTLSEKLRNALRQVACAYLDYHLDKHYVRLDMLSGLDRPQPAGGDHAHAGDVPEAAGKAPNASAEWSAPTGDD